MPSKKLDNVRVMPGSFVNSLQADQILQDIRTKQLQRKLAPHEGKPVKPSPDLVCEEV